MYHTYYMARIIKDRDATRALALRLIASGCSQREAARRADVSQETVRRWIREERGEIPASSASRGVAAPTRPPPAPAPPPDDASPEDVSDTLAMLRRMMGETRRRAEEAAREGNHTAAQRYGRDVANLLNTIARVEKDTQRDADVLRVSRAEIAAAWAALQERWAAICSRPLHCAGCGRALSVELAKSGPPRDGA